MNKSIDKKASLIKKILTKVKDNAIATGGKNPDANMFFSLAFCSESELESICKKSGIVI